MNGEVTVARDRAAVWERRTAPALIVATVVFLLAYAAPIVAPALPAPAVWWCNTIQFWIWGMFIADYFTRLYLSANRGRFFVTHLLDLVTVVLPVLRSLRLLRLFALVTVITRRVALHSQTARVTAYVISSAGFLWLVGGLAITEAERGRSQANIQTAADGWWWAITTMTTVGYGDRYPTTATGKVIGTALMVTGIALLSVVTAAVASWFVSQFRQVEDSLSEEMDASQRSLAELEVKIDLLIREVAELRNAGTGTPPHPVGVDPTGADAPV